LAQQVAIFAKPLPGISFRVFQGMNELIAEHNHRLVFAALKNLN
jgi:hypothetical protein